MIYISTKGRRHAEGTETDPFDSLEAAVGFLRESGSSDREIVAEEGTYYVSGPLMLGAEDSHTVFRAREKGTARFCGSRPVTGWEIGSLNGTTVWFKDLGPEYGTFHSLFDGKTCLPRPRFPKQSFFFVKGVSDEDAIFNGDPNLRMQRAMFADPENVLPFYQIGDVTLRILHYWKDETVNLTKADPQSGRLEFSKRVTMTIRPGDRFYYENVREQLTEPGEWYFDTAIRRLYFVPRPEDRIESTVLYAGAARQFCRIDGADDVTFDGLTFEKSDWRIPVDTWYKTGADHHQAAYDVEGAFEIRNASGICFRNCRFINILSTCLRFGVNVQNFSVTGCLFRYIGANAVFAVGENLPKTDPRVTRQFRISDNHIYQYGRRFHNGTAVGILHACEGEIANNEIHDGYTIAVTIGWVWGYGYSVTSDILVKQNHIYKIGQGLLADMAAVYTLGVKEGVVITENIVHDVEANLKYGYGGWGLYTDEGSSNVLITKNIAYNCNSTAFYQHYGRDNLIINNILAFSGEGEVSSFRDQPHVGFHLIRNILVSDDSEFISMQDIIREKKRGRFNDANNICWDYRRGDRGIDRDWFNRELGLYNAAVFTDPKFVDPEKRDFRLQPDSPVFALGFQPWDYEKAGTVTKFDPTED